jgi:hypothetical protein
LDWNPQRRLDDADATRRHQSILAIQPQTPADRRARFQAFRKLNAELRPLVKHSRNRAQRDLVRLQAALDAEAILGRRDYSFVLHPENRLRSFLTSGSQSLFAGRT